VTREDDKSDERRTRSVAEGDAKVIDKKRPDPFAPLPLPETLTGKTSRESAPTPPPPVPSIEPAAPLPATAFTSRVTGEHDAPVVPFDASADEAPLEPEREPPPVVEEPAWVDAPALATPEPASPIVVENELRDAVGATPIVDKKKKDKPAKKKRASTESGDDDDDDRRGGGKLWMFVVALAVMLGGGITAMILVGRSNSENYYLTCAADRVIIQQGRSFPPWGKSDLEDAEWKSFKIPPEAPCVPFETTSKARLAESFVKLLEGRAEKLVGGKGGQSTAIAAIDPEDPVAKVDEAEATLKQALLVSRHLLGDAAINKRTALEHWLGDVTYWRAAARLRAAATALDDAAKQFATAATQQPEVNRDSDAWATLARRLAAELRAGPGGAGEADPIVTVNPSGEPTKTPAPIGTALPVEPPNAGSAAPPAPAVDAGVPSSGGGVLL
jgi:hypothetical protein